MKAGPRPLPVRTVAREQPPWGDAAIGVLCSQDVACDAYSHASPHTLLWPETQCTKELQRECQEAGACRGYYLEVLMGGGDSRVDDAERNLTTGARSGYLIGLHHGEVGYRRASTATAEMLGFFISALAAAYRR